VIFNAHNLYFKRLRHAWQPILRQDGFGAFNGYCLEWREPGGYSSRSILINKGAYGFRVQLWHAFNGHAVREVPFSPQNGAFTTLHVLELSPDPNTFRDYLFYYGDSEAAIQVNVATVVDAYMRYGRPFFRLA
jgi:hypothetical protein